MTVGLVRHPGFVHSDDVRCPMCSDPPPCRCHGSWYVHSEAQASDLRAIRNVLARAADLAEANERLFRELKRL